MVSRWDNRSAADGLGVGAAYGRTGSTADGNVANDDFTLSATSALIDAGDIYVLDADGSRSDIGAYGGEYGAG